MSEGVRVELVDVTGTRRSIGSEAGLQEVLAAADQPDSALQRLGGDTRTGECSRAAVFRAAEDLRFVSRRGTPKGFVTVLPRGRLLDACVEAYNVEHLAALDAHPIEFPLVFDRRGEELTELTSGYEGQGRMFRFDDRDTALRLSYAADPNLLEWLKDQTVDDGRLPYTVYSPQPVFRRFPSGELGLERLRQYTVPDVHTLCSVTEAMSAYVYLVERACESMQFWFGDDYCHIVDFVDGSDYDADVMAPILALAGARHTIVRRLPSRRKYYAVKGGLYVNAGFGNVMLYNFQLDDVNPARFRIHTSDGRPAILLHSTVASGWPKMLPITLGRGLAGISPKAFPLELAREQLVLVPVTEQHLSPAQELATRLATACGLRVTVDKHWQRSLGVRLAALRRDWQPSYAVLGDAEARGGEVKVQGLVRDGSVPLSAFLTTHLPRLRRCRPLTQSTWADPPLL